MRYQIQETNTNCITYENDCIIFISLPFRLQCFIFVFICISSHCWQNEWVGNLLITYVSWFLRVFSFLLLCSFFCCCCSLCQMHLPFGACTGLNADAIHVVALKFIAGFLADSNHHYHLSRVRLLSCSPSSISYGDFGTKF